MNCVIGKRSTSYTSTCSELTHSSKLRLGVNRDLDAILLVGVLEQRLVQHGREAWVGAYVFKIVGHSGSDHVIRNDNRSLFNS